MGIDTNALAKFLVKAKMRTHAGNGSEAIPQRPGFEEREYTEGDWNYRDSYSGYYSALGSEVVRFMGEPVWGMSYSGGMAVRYHGDLEIAKQTFEFLKKALMRVDVSRPFRGPKSFREGNYYYVDSSKGDISDFSGTEKILFMNSERFRQNYVGRLIVKKLP